MPARSASSRLLVAATAALAHAVDDALQVTEAFTLDQGRWLLVATLVGAAPVSLPPFDAIAVDLAALWP